MKAKKVTRAERKNMLAVVSKLSPAQRDEVLTDLILFAERAVPILNELTKDSSLSRKEKKEIEDSISVGPAWLRYSHRVRREK